MAKENRSMGFERLCFAVKTGRCGFLFALKTGLRFPSQFYK
jgi:hypothetical protein